jgi:hypothetical protein
MNNQSIIGKIVDTSGTYDDEGNELTAPTYISGFHVNTTSEVADWSDYLCDPQPSTPMRVYAGGVVPVCYSLPDEDTFNELQEPTPP